MLECRVVRTYKAGRREGILIVRWAAGCQRGVTIITLHHHPTQENPGLSTEQLNKDVCVCGVCGFTEPKRKLPTAVPLIAFNWWGKATSLSQFCVSVSLFFVFPPPSSSSMSSEWIKPAILDLLFSQEKGCFWWRGRNSGVCIVAYFQEACVLVHVCRLYHISSSFPLATRLLGCIKDNYSTIDCHGGPITVFPVTVVRFRITPHRRPLKLNPFKH